MRSLPPVPAADALVLRTKRLELLPINRTYAAEMFNVLCDPALYLFTSGLPPADVLALARRYEFWEHRVSPDHSELWLNWALRLREENALIGHMQAGVLPDHADVAWFLGVRWQHRGYATEAAEAILDWLLQLGIREIRASINPAHLASIRVAERLGLRRTTDFSDNELIWKRVYSKEETHPATG